MTFTHLLTLALWFLQSLLPIWLAVELSLIVWQKRKRTLQKYAECFEVKTFGTGSSAPALKPNPAFVAFMDGWEKRNRL